MIESEIIDQLQQGSEAAFKELVENYQKMVINTCYGMIHNLEDAEDVAQDVFIEVFRSIKNFRSDSKISTWLYRIAINRSLNFIRDYRRKKWFHSIDNHQKRPGENKWSGLVTGKEENPDFGMEMSERAQMLFDSIGSLPKNQQVAFTLSKYEDLSYKEISEVMNLSVSSVESLIFRAKKNLQKKLYVCYKKKCI